MHCLLIPRGYNLIPQKSDAIDLVLLYPAGNVLVHEHKALILSCCIVNNNQTATLVTGVSGLGHSGMEHLSSLLLFSESNPILLSQSASLGIFKYRLLPLLMRRFLFRDFFFACPAKQLVLVRWEGVFTYVIYRGRRLVAEIGSPSSSSSSSSTSVTDR